MVDPGGTPPNPSQVWLTAPGAARTQKVVGGFTVVSTLLAGTLGVVHADAAWQVVLWVVASVVVVLLGVGIAARAGEDARATVALRATGVATRAEVLSAEENAGEDDVSYALTLWVALPGGAGFQAVHSCGNHTCVSAAQRSDAVLEVLVDPVVRTWAVVH
ncbi:hypothetical protein AB0A74_22225 [Saccharothrix sp. NPDC042600]|uniref:hypothetical protein n=1 Tax=Saccharothrix TaxID=2071 RepID=UPI0033EC37FF|nr:hypothetical protein GCM10017745_53440 [Saccharothrix mutabilis subsp. capreolus]